MSKITLQYRHNFYSITIDTTKPIVELKKVASELTGIQVDKFSLLVKKFEVIDSKRIDYYIDNGDTNFQMIDVRINVKVVINGRNYSCNVGESRMIGCFADDLVKLSGLDTHLSIFHKGVKLEDRETILSSGVENNDAINAVKVQPCAKKKTVTVQYRKKNYTIEIKETKSVLHLKSVISTLTGILVENFCLKFDKRFLLDSKPVSSYESTDYAMENVTILVIIVSKGVEYPILIQESETVDELKEKFITQSSSPDDFYLFHNFKVLEATDKVLRTDIENNSVVFAVTSERATVTVTYRSTSHSVTIDTSRTVKDLKLQVSELFGIKAEHFSLNFYWMPWDDAKTVSEYVKYGTNIRMTNVTIKIYANLDEKKFSFNVKEETTIGDFKSIILQKAKRENYLNLYYNGQLLLDECTLLESNVEHQCAILVLSTLRGG